MDELRNDYRDMQQMIFHEAPTFDEVLDSLSVLEGEINQLEVHE